MYLNLYLYVFLLSAEISREQWVLSLYDILIHRWGNMYHISQIRPRQAWSGAFGVFVLPSSVSSLALVQKMR